MAQLEELGRLLQRHRMNAGLTMETLAAASGIPKSVIGRLERGEVQAPYPDRLVKIARALGTDVEDYFALAGYYTPQGLPDLPVYLRTKYGVAPETAQEAVDYFNYLRQKEHSDDKDQAA